jgi:hypothetical protein
LDNRAPIIGPEGLASRPMTTLGFLNFVLRISPKAAAYLTTSNGDKVSPGLPPMVPRIPAIDFINVNFLNI